MILTPLDTQNCKEVIRSENISFRNLHFFISFIFILPCWVNVKFKGYCNYINGINVDDLQGDESKGIDMININITTTTAATVDVVARVTTIALNTFKYWNYQS